MWKEITNEHSATLRSLNASSPRASSQCISAGSCSSCWSGCNVHALYGVTATLKVQQLLVCLQFLSTVSSLSSEEVQRQSTLLCVGWYDIYNLLLS